MARVLAWGPQDVDGAVALVAGDDEPVVVREDDAGERRIGPFPGRCRRAGRCWGQFRTGAGFGALAGFDRSGDRGLVAVAADGQDWFGQEGGQDDQAQGQQQGLQPRRQSVGGWGWCGRGGLVVAGACRCRRRRSRGRWAGARVTGRARCGWCGGW